MKSFICLVAITTIFVGCDNLSIKSIPSPQVTPPMAVASNPMPATMADLGIVSEDIVYSCVIGGNARKKVAKVDTSCGCTTPGVQKGDLLDFAKAFQITVDMNGKEHGKGSQRIAITFDDGTSHSIRLTYDYQPLPYAEPQYLLFRQKDGEKTVKLVFPGEPDIRVESVEFPGGTFQKRSSGYFREGSHITLTLVANYSQLNNALEDVIRITTSSERRPTIKVPFLILLN